MKRYQIIAAFSVLSLLGFSSCEKFLNPKQELNITEDLMFTDWYEYRSVEMGMYGLQQELVEQLFILGELRGDLVDVTSNATTDMVEIYNFQVSKDNEYADPTNLFKLINAANNFISVLQREHPEVLDPEGSVTNFDRLYGEALCMRAWAYFNGVRIYGKMPLIPESLVTFEEVEDFVNSPGSYIDSVYISFNKDGYNNDTTENVPVELEKHYLDTDMVIDHFTYQLENDLKAVGVNHYIENNDITWEVTIWNEWARHALLGHMYLTRGDLAMAAEHFEEITYNSTENLRYQLDNSFSYGSWGNIFTEIDSREHIYTLWFNKANFQQNEFQNFFENWGPHSYMLKPSYQAVFNWETEWRGQSISSYVPGNELATVELTNRGFPSDYFRGIGTSYMYIRNAEAITAQEYFSMLTLRADGDDRNSKVIMEGMDTLIFKYSLGKYTFDQDANYIIYRAGGIQLYLAEIYTYWVAVRGGGPKTDTEESVGILNDGSNYDIRSSREQMGVRGRVGLGNGYDGYPILDDVFIHDPFTNEIIGYRSMGGDFNAKKELHEERIIDERARELAFEGERFYDLMRVAKRRNDPSFLADRVAAKFPSGQREAIRSLLMVEENWYIDYFDDKGDSPGI